MIISSKIKIKFNNKIQIIINSHNSKKKKSYSTSIAKEIFDDTNSETTFYSGIGLSLLSLAASPTDTKKAKLYVRFFFFLKNF